MSCVYLLVDPRDNKPFYVGATSLPLERAKDHLNLRNTSSTLEARLIEIRSLQWEPIFVVIEDGLSKAAAHERERYWIRLLREQGHTLLQAGE